MCFPVILQKACFKSQIKTLKTMLVDLSVIGLIRFVTLQLMCCVCASVRLWKRVRVYNLFITNLNVSFTRYVLMSVF